ncbi:hypothetical protein C815_01164 [Firmicutes bacterium M10-2]|nr:hypothetical protein C815_01164 [Firmicutes bacterium M10-2]
MHELAQQLILYALQQKASDIHFFNRPQAFSIQLRTLDGMIDLHQDHWNASILSYLKFIADFDLTSPKEPQSGSFTIFIQQRPIQCRLSVIHNQNVETAVLRLLSCQVDLKIEQLTSNSQAITFMYSLCRSRQGLYIACGPTNSGKTTTIHAILHQIATNEKQKIVSLEDPIEIADPLYLQLQINEQEGFGYEKGIEELMRHDPDILYIGEIRNAYCAKKLVNAALSGHMVVSTLHAGTIQEAVLRLFDFGIEPFELAGILSGMFASRLYKKPDGTKECVYEIANKEELLYLLRNKKYPKDHQTLAQEIERAIHNQSIQDEQAKCDLMDLQR